MAATIADGSAQLELSVRSVEAPLLLLLLLVALDTGEVLHELDDVLGELGDSFCVASDSPFVLCWCALPMSAAAAAVGGGNGSTMITLLMGIAVFVVVVAVNVVAATLLVASASWAAALRADFSIGVGGR